MVSLVVSAYAQKAPAAPGNWQNAERAKLRAGVKELPKYGAPGPVAIFGTFAFPVVAANADGKAQLALVAAAAYGKGKALIYGHTGYLDGANLGGSDAGVFLVNAVKWCGGKEKPRVGVRNGKSEAFLDKHGLRAKAFRTVDKKDLADFDVVILSPSDLSDGEAAALGDYIKGGGGVIAAATGWAYDQISGGKNLNDEHPGNKALRAAGLAWTTMTFPDQVKSFPPVVDLPSSMNAAEAVLALRKQKPGAAVDEAAMNQGVNALQVALSCQPSQGSALTTAVVAALGEGSSIVPTQQKPLLESDVAARLRLGIETRILKLASGTDIKAHPAAAVFPGVVPSDTKRVSQEVAIDPSVPGWRSTGLYASAGEKISVKVPDSLLGQGYSLRIGCHTDSLYHLDKWMRAPEITRTVPIKTALTETSSGFGGLIYIVVPAKAEGGAAFSVTIAGGVPAPLFVLGKTTDEQWKEIVKRPAPWTELACKGVVLCCPTEAARTIRNPTELMSYWQKVSDVEDELSNVGKDRKRPERIVADVQISAGYMHSGYPIMVPVSAALEMVTYTRLKWPGWGFYHEIGHNHQKPEWTFEGTTEVTNNVFSLYCFEAALGKPKTTGHTAVSEEAQKEHWLKHKKAGVPYATWKKDPFLALTTYLQLIDGFGWDAVKAYFDSYNDSTFGPLPTNDDEKRDQFMVRYSKVTKKNLGPFFDAWGIPVSSAAKASIAGMETWLPKAMK